MSASAPKCNEALSRDLWPLDPFESAPMRATSSIHYNGIRNAILAVLKLKGLSFASGGKEGRNSLSLKKIPCNLDVLVDLHLVYTAQ